MANKIKLGRGTKARIETVKNNLDDFEIVYSTDTNELGVKNNDGTITYFGVVTELEWSNILNKPNFSAVATSGAYADLTGKPNLDLKLDKNFSALPTQTNPLLTDVLVINRGTVAQKVTLGNILAQVDNEIFVVVATLPTTGVVNKIYLLPKGTPGSQDGYDEYIWVNNAWELIGSINLDLSNYYNKTEVNGLLSAKVDKNAAITAGTSPKITYDAKGLVTGGEALAASDIPNLAASKITTGTFAAARIPTLEISKVTNLQSSLDNKVDKVSGKGLSTNDYTNTDKQSVEKIPTIEQDILDLESDKVDKVSGMGLSSNDFTTTEKNKLSGIQAGAQVNAVTTVAGRTGAVVLTKADVGLGSVQNYAIASKTQAESGTSNDLYMTPLRTKELITVVMGDIESVLDAILGV